LTRTQAQIYPRKWRLSRKFFSNHGLHAHNIDG
jgi:hypothetical protein